MSMKIQELKNRGQKITCLTAYSFPIAKIIDPHCDLILVGDSLAMTIYGETDTTKATVEMMIAHAKAVVKARKNALVIVDLPANSYETSPNQALATAKLVLEQTKCDAIKIETPPNLMPIVKFLVQNNIPVIAHIGLMPQYVNEIGGYKYQGTRPEEAEKIFANAIELEKAGVLAIVIEAVPAKLATQITKSLTIPTIGIGASADCDGQVLVIDDLIGLNQEFTPRFVKKYCNIATEIEIAVKNFAQDVAKGTFPAKEHLFEKDG